MLPSALGRTLKQSNPYAGDSLGNGSPAYWTTNTYDELSRVTRVTLPDNQTVQTVYAGASPGVGATVTVTDQVGRQRKSEVDGLGRLAKVIEQNPATGLLDPANYLTTYSYDVLDNLKTVNQGNQTRTFVYDALSRVTSQTTPEAGTVTFTYTSFDAVQTRTDALGVITTYGYDGLNRPQTVSYRNRGGVRLEFVDISFHWIWGTELARQALTGGLKFPRAALSHWRRRVANEFRHR